jgi:predicted HTH domain antitoxin
MAEIVFDFPPTVFSALRKSPSEFAVEMRLAAALHWYSQGTISQGKAAEIAGLSRAELLEELHRRKIPAIQVTPEELEEELRRDL